MAGHCENTSGHTSDHPLPALDTVMTYALVLNLRVAATAGLGIPAAMQKLGRDPAIGSSVLITAITDSGGFFIFPG